MQYGSMEPNNNYANDDFITLYAHSVYNTQVVEILAKSRPISVIESSPLLRPCRMPYKLSLTQTNKYPMSAIRPIFKPPSSKPTDF